jgi:predicted DNA-binding antitoxin AbrB/MazE fold protein
VISGFNIYSLKESLAKEKEYAAENHKITIKEVKVFDVAQNPHLLLVFLNNALKRLMLKNRFQELGKTGGRYFDTSRMKPLDNLRLYDGYKVNFLRLEKQVFLRVDSIKKVVREDTVLDFINAFYRKHNSIDKEKIR